MQINTHSTAIEDGQVLPHPLDGRTQDEMLKVMLADGEELTGKYFKVAGMHFIEVKNPSAPTGSSAIGPLKAGNILGVDVVKTANQVKQEQFEWSRGERVPGRAPETREDFRYRLEVLARAYHNEAGSWRKHQLLRQFNDCADKIELAKAKREWLLREVDWYQSHNIPPEMSDLWFESMASPSLLKKPREQDFDPDPLERRKRTPYPAEIVAERLSIPNVLSLLKKMGCRAYIALAAENVYEKAVICINFNEVPGRSKIRLYGERSGGQTVWQIKFDCGNSKQANRRKVRIMLLPSYNHIEHMLADALARQQQPINRQDPQTSQ